MTTSTNSDRSTTPTASRVRRFAASVTVTALIGFLAVAAGAPPAGAQVGRSYDASVDRTIADIQTYWAQTMPSVYGSAYEPIPASRVFPYSESNPPPNCDDAGRTTAPYEDVAGNAFYCSNGDFVAYDEQGLIPKLRSQFGEFAVGLVFAHELGHAVQARVGYAPSATVYLEQQADCFAGAWAEHVATSTEVDVHLATSDLDTALAGLLALRDPSGVDGSQEGAHGNGFDRVSAFQDGFEGGAPACAAYQNDPPTVTESAFTSESDYQNSGNLPLDELMPAVTKSLETYWTTVTSKFTGATKLVAGDAARAAASCATADEGALDDASVYCAATDTVTYDVQRLTEEHDAIGDFAPAVLLATEYASSVQHALGREVGTAAGRTASLCLAGAWAANIGSETGDGSSTLSPGDLDEAVAALVASRSGNVDRGSAFDRVAAFRTGFHDGPSSCVASTRSASSNPSKMSGKTPRSADGRTSRSV